jgi:hypothetical protein
MSEPLLGLASQEALPNKNVNTEHNDESANCWAPLPRCKPDVYQWGGMIE